MFACQCSMYRWIHWCGWWFKLVLLDSSSAALAGRHPRRSKLRCSLDILGPSVSWSSSRGPLTTGRMELFQLLASRIYRCFRYLRYSLFDWGQQVGVIWAKNARKRVPTAGVHLTCQVSDEKGRSETLLDICWLTIPREVPHRVPDRVRSGISRRSLLVVVRWRSVRPHVWVSWQRGSTAMCCKWPPPSVTIPWRHSGHVLSMTLPLKNGAWKCFRSSDTQRLWRRISWIILALPSVSDYISQTCGVLSADAVGCCFGIIRV